MIRSLPDGFELDDDPARVDLDQVHRFLSTEACEADLVVGLYRDGWQDGFCRAFTDGVSSAYLADVYVLPELRGRGLGVELVREMVENGAFTGVKWLLHTTHAHGLYEQFGFGRPDAKMKERLP